MLDGSSRIDVAIARVLAMPEATVLATLEATRADFAVRHRDLAGVYSENYALVAQRRTVPQDISDARRQLIGAYFTHEYSVEAAALGNPSMVLAPDQSGVASGDAKFVMSLRAIGEGHISCIEFRSGIIRADLSLALDPPSRHAITGRRSPALHDRERFRAKVAELDALSEVTEAVLDSLGSTFSVAELEAAIRLLERVSPYRASLDAAHVLHWLASSNYHTAFSDDTDLSERVIFPAGPTESRGMEDVRLVRFVHDDASIVYYGTYTAFDGYQILPQLIETTDFLSFRISTLSGRCAQNKGIALFPRKLGGQFVALGRHDNVNNFLMTSEDIRVWHETELIQEPKRPWELMQLGNCGSPLETEAGWLVITHGVGPMRRYSLGALLLDREDPAKVIGHLQEPLLTPHGDEREGYVPNVVYSCGSVIHNEHLVVPYGFADVGAGVATVPLEALLERLVG